MRVVHCKKKNFDVYVGRMVGGDFHFGNPFTHLNYGSGLVRVDSRQEAIRRFATWLQGISDITLEPDRRKWILDNLDELRGKVLGCYCKPKACHGDILAKLANEDNLLTKE